MSDHSPNDPSQFRKREPSFDEGAFSAPPVAPLPAVDPAQGMAAAYAAHAAPTPDPVFADVADSIAQAQVDASALQAKTEELAQLQVKSAELADQYLRAKAEVDNARRRADEEVSKARKFAVEGFADSLLPVLDSLEAGLAFKDASPEQIREGAEATLRQLKAALERNKVVAIDPAAGTKFDPHQHQAISVVPAPEGSTQDANTIVSVLQKGYLISERVLRPALVTVSAPK